MKNQVSAFLRVVSCIAVLVGAVILGTAILLFVFGVILSIPVLVFLGAVGTVLMVSLIAAISQEFE